MNSKSDMDDNLSADEESIKRRREKLIRRPSYRKILNDIARAELGCEYTLFVRAFDCLTSQTMTESSSYIFFRDTPIFNLLAIQKRIFHFKHRVFESLFLLPIIRRTKQSDSNFFIQNNFSSISADLNF